MTDLPAYTGQITRCKKCGAGRVSTTFHYGAAIGKKTSRGGTWPCEHRLGIDEHLCRDCPNCGYAWAEACVNSRGGETGEQREKGYPCRS